MQQPSADDPAQPGGPFLLRSPVWRWLAAVAAGLVLGLATLRLGLLPDTGAVPVGWLATAAAAISATILAWILGLTPVWRIAAAMAPGVAALVLLYSPPLWVLPVLLVIASGVFWNVRRERVPLYLSNRQTLAAVAQLTRDLPSGAVVDLGCGLAGSVVALAKQLPDRTVVGGRKRAAAVRGGMAARHHVRPGQRPRPLWIAVGGTAGRLPPCLLFSVQRTDGTTCPESKG